MNLGRLLASSVPVTEAALACCPEHSLRYAYGAALQAARGYVRLKADEEVFSVLYAQKPYGALLRWVRNGDEHEIVFAEMGLIDLRN